MGKILPLTPARKLTLDYNQAIVRPARRDITDYGPPGDHLHGPLALKGPTKASRLGLDGAGGGGGGGACPGLGGGTVNFFQRITNPSSAVYQSAVIPYPFMITHIAWFMQGAVTEVEEIAFYVSESESTTVGDYIYWDPILLVQSEHRWIRPTGNTNERHWYPNFPVRESNKRIKISYDNTGSAARDLQVAFDIIRMS